MAKGTMTDDERFEKIWPDIQALAVKLIVTAAEHENGDPRIAAMAMSLATASVIAGLSSSEEILRLGLKLNADFLEEHAKSLHRDIHGGTVQ